MPKFKRGSPQLTFRKKNGGLFTKTYHSRSAAISAMRGWKANGGGRPVKTGRFKGRYSKNSRRFLKGLFAKS